MTAKNEQFSLAIDDQSSSIQGVKIPDQSIYQKLKFVVKSNVMEGWQPTSTDIKELKAFMETPHPELEQQFKTIFGD